MKYEFIAEFSQVHPVKLMCTMLKVSRSGYYSFAQGIKSEREEANEQLLEEIRTIHEASHETYGSPRIHYELSRVKGIRCGKHRIARLMRKAGIMGRVRRRFRTTTRPDPKARYAPDRLQRQFEATHPHQVWMSDLTYIWTEQGWLYLAVVLDLFTRMVVGWATGKRITAELVCRAVNSAVVKYGPGCEIIFHSDRGSQYTSTELGELFSALDQRAIFTISHATSCYDNAVAESFFHTLKTEWVYFEHYQTREAAHQSLFEYIEIFYNRTRRHSSLGNATPLEINNQYQQERKPNSLSEEMG